MPWLFVVLAGLLDEVVFGGAALLDVVVLAGDAGLLVAMVFGGGLLDEAGLVGDLAGAEAVVDRFGGGGGGFGVCRMVAMVRFSGVRWIELVTPSVAT
ncbi:MAG: hypothetical protein Q8S33_02315 [Myxococcales bacterium]|nr:hypothetical protein [Myxococcales bacterium]